MKNVLPKWGEDKAPKKSKKTKAVKKFSDVSNQEYNSSEYSKLRTDAKGRTRGVEHKSYDDERGSFNESVKYKRNKKVIKSKRVAYKTDKNKKVVSKYKDRIKNKDREAAKDSKPLMKPLKRKKNPIIAKKGN